MSALEKDYGVLLYCNGKKDLEPEITDLLDLSYRMLDKKNPITTSSINISEDGNLPEEYFNKFNVVVDCTDHRVISLYKNMIKALNPKSWCFITNFNNVNPASEAGNHLLPFLKRIALAERKRLDLVKTLLTEHCKDFHFVFQEKTVSDEFNSTYIIFFGGETLL